jgi:hypothetical protein
VIFFPCSIHVIDLAAMMFHVSKRIHKFEPQAPIHIFYRSWFLGQIKYVQTGPK